MRFWILNQVVSLTLSLNRKKQIGRERENRSKEIVNTYGRRDQNRDIKRERDREKREKEKIKKEGHKEAR